MNVHRLIPEAVTEEAKKAYHAYDLIKYAMGERLLNMNSARTILALRRNIPKSIADEYEDAQELWDEAVKIVVLNGG